MHIKNPSPPCICCYTTIEALMSAKQALNDKLQGIVAAYLRCGGIANNQIKKGLLLSLRVNFFNRWIFGKVTSKKRDCLVHFRRLLAVCWPRIAVRVTVLGPALQNILRQYYDNLTTIPKLRSTYNGRLIYEHLTKNARLFLGTIHFHFRKIVWDSVH